LANLVEVAGELEKEGLTEINKSGQFAGGRNLKGVYGFTVRLGLGGTPQFERSGSKIGEENCSGEEDVREPIVDIIAEADHFLIIAEMPGVEEQDIKLEFGEDTLHIATCAESGSGRKYSKEISLKDFKKPVEFTRSYRNGLLEIRLKKN
jgi:HSP20 family protein